MNQTLKITLKQETMNNLGVDINKSIDFSKPKTITQESIVEYYDKIHKK